MKIRWSRLRRDLHGHEPVGGGFGADVEVKNLGDPVSSWRLTWTFTAGQAITQAWNGTATQSGSQVSVTNAAYNDSIPTGGTARFGFNGSWTTSNPAPSSFALDGTTCTGVVTPTASTTGASQPPTSTSQPPSTSATPTPFTTFNNPVVWQDFADGDIIRVGDAYYYSASTMHYAGTSPPNVPGRTGSVLSTAMIRRSVPRGPGKPRGPGTSECLVVVH